MLWKTEYEIGVPVIDKQHYNLFFHAEKLIYTIKNMDDVYYKEECIKTLEFLKGYVVQHFHDEEEYQESIGYIGLEIHRKQHADFTNTVLEYEKMFLKSDFDITLVRNFTGTMLSWLVHHVIDSDKRIVSGENPVTLLEELDRRYTTCYISATTEVLKQMFGADVTSTKEMLYKSQMIGDVFCKIEVKGKTDAIVIVSIPNRTVINGIQEISGNKLEVFDEIVLSACGEFADIISSKVCMLLSAEDEGKYTINPPIVTTGEYNDRDNLYDGSKSIIFDTSLGDVEILIKELV